MEIYQIQVTQYMQGFYEVEASSREEALDKFFDGDAALVHYEIGDLACNERDIWIDEGSWGFKCQD